MQRDRSIPDGVPTARAAGLSPRETPVTFRAAGLSPRETPITDDAPTTVTLVKVALSTVEHSRRLKPAAQCGRGGLESSANSSSPPLKRSTTLYARAFTLVELLIVMGIIAILISAVMVASTTLINRSKTSNTRAVLTIVRQAVEEFAREQKANPTLTRPQAYRTRYGLFPPDELEVFSPSGIPYGPAGTRAPGGAVTVPAPGNRYPPMKFYTKGLPPSEVALEHRDLSALIVAIETYGDTSSTMLDSLPERNRIPAPIDPSTSDPLLFLDRTGNGWSSDDLQIRLIVDDWGMPISYFAQRDWVKPNGTATASNNHSAWNEASTVFIRNNDGQPVIMSYGPNGRDQLTAEAMGTQGTASLVWDFEGEKDDQITNPLNADNVYADPALKEKLARGLKEKP